MNWRWLFRIGINPEPRHDLDYWYLWPATGEIVTLEEIIRRVKITFDR